MAKQGPLNKWILCFERAKRAVVRCQRSWRRKLACRAAHRRLLVKQWLRAGGAPQDAEHVRETAGSVRDGKKNLKRMRGTPTPSRTRSRTVTVTRDHGRGIAGS